MKLLLDARKIVDGGIGTYLRNLISGLQNHPEIKLSVLVRPTEAAHPLIASLPQVKTAAGLYSFSELFTLSREVPWSSFNLFHTPHFVLPLGIPIPSVITIHDLNHIFNPEKFFYPLIAAPYVISSLSRARQIIAVSEQTRAEIDTFCRWWRGAPHKVSVIPNSVALSGNSGRPRESRVPLEERNPDESPYLLAVISTDKPHKGTSDLLVAFEQIARCHPGLDLVVVGAGTPSPEKIPPSITPRVRLRGRVAAEELDRLYRSARAIVVASVREGFCLPILESHAVGVPVIARPVPAIQSLMVEDDTLAVDMSTEALKDAIGEHLARPAANRRRLVKHAAQFSIPKITAQTVDCYWRALR